MFKGKNVLVTGASGMIGRELTELLKKDGANVFIADLKQGNDLRNFQECLKITRDKDVVFHLAGVKGNPKMTKERPVSFMGPMLQFDTNMILASQVNEVERFMYTSSIAVENPESDTFPAHAKATAEILIDAMRIQYPTGTKWCIVRPANVYGRFDDFSNPNAMVITSLINRAIKDKILIMDNKGSQQIRDFINAKDVARGMMEVMDKMPGFPVNLCSGKGTSVMMIASIIAKELNIPIEYVELNLVLGPQSKVMNLNWNFKPKINIVNGLTEVIKWANGNRV